MMLAQRAVHHVVLVALLNAPVRLTNTLTVVEVVIMFAVKLNI